VGPRVFLKKNTNSKNNTMVEVVHECTKTFADNLSL
jgi:hypothetical protein